MRAAARTSRALTYATQEGGCLVGVLAAKMAQKLGGHTVGAVGGLKIPPVDSYIAGYKFCAAKAVPGTKLIVQYSGDFGAADKCQAVAQNEIGQGAKVLFQVAGGCGIGALKAAAAAKLYGIGVDADEYNDAPRILTSAIKKTDIGVYDAVTQAGRRQVPGRQRPAAQPEEQRRGRGPDQPGRPEGVDHADEQLPRADHLREAQAPGRPAEVGTPLSGTQRKGGPRARPSRSLGD